MFVKLQYIKLNMKNEQIEYNGTGTKFKTNFTRHSLDTPKSADDKTKQTHGSIVVEWYQQIFSQS